MKNKLKIGYIFTSAGLNPDSVQKKVMHQIQYLNTADCECRGLFLTNENVGSLKYNEWIDFIKIPEGNGKYFKSLQSKIIVIRTVIKLFKTESKTYDYFFMRYPMASFRLWYYLIFNKNKIIIEHLSDEISELKLYKKELKFALRPSELLSYFEHLWYPMANERLFRQSINKNTRLLLCNSKEILNLQKVNLSRINWMVSGDAVEVNNFRLKRMESIHNTIHFVFLKGASTNAEFNGLERFIQCIETYSGPYQLFFHILGNNLVYEKSLITDSNKIILHSRMQLDVLDEFMDKMHIGVSTLGLYRKNLNETTTIKTREYFARGLPFIYAYKDTDMELYPEMKAFALQFSNDDSAIDINEVIRFALAQYENLDHGKQMRQLAEAHLSYKIKMAKILEHLANNRS
jgi:hypothetical protein